VAGQIRAAIAFHRNRLVRQFTRDFLTACGERTGIAFLKSGRLFCFGQFSDCFLNVGLVQQKNIVVGDDKVQRLDFSFLRRP